MGRPWYRYRGDEPVTPREREQPAPQHGLLDRETLNELYRTAIDPVRQHTGVRLTRGQLHALLYEIDELQEVVAELVRLLPLHDQQARALRERAAWLMRDGDKPEEA